MGKKRVRKRIGVSHYTGVYPESDEDRYLDQQVSSTNLRTPDSLEDWQLLWWYNASGCNSNHNTMPSRDEMVAKLEEFVRIRVDNSQDGEAMKPFPWKPSKQLILLKHALWKYFLPLVLGFSACLLVAWSYREFSSAPSRSTGLAGA